MAPQPSVPSFDEIRPVTFENFKKIPCAWQIRVCEAVLRGDRDIISIAGTGMGKTLTFWMPLVFRPQGIQLIVTPLNILGEQNTTILDRLGIEAIFISATTATEHNFRVSFACPALFCIALHLFRILLHFATVLLSPIPRSSCGPTALLRSYCKIKSSTAISSASSLMKRIAFHNGVHSGASIVILADYAIYSVRYALS